MQLKIVQGEYEKTGGYHYEYDAGLKPLGEGGMGVVYKGFKVYETTGSRSVVAIKVLYDGLPAEVYERAEREASIRLRNDNMVEMLGFICQVEQDKYGMQRNKYYVISEYLNGVVLSDFLTGQFLDKDGIEIPFAKQLYTNYIVQKEKTSIEIIKCILSGIMALHDKGYIHRDIDPTNIMVTDDGKIKLIDFGIAKYVRSLGSVDKSLTSTGKFLGKAEFASPELVVGDIKNQSYSTDIYAIGILFYQLLVGKLPFTGSKYEILQMQLKSKVPVKHVKNPLLQKIIKKATEKSKDDRYATVVEFRVELDKVNGYTPGFLSRYWMSGLVVIMICVACAALFYWINGADSLQNGSVEKETALALNSSSGDDELALEKLERDFDNALEKLDSKDHDLALEGLRLMQSLAEKNYKPAVAELGLTYCVYTKVQSPRIKQRRKTLQLVNNGNSKESFNYLKNINIDDPVSDYVMSVIGYSYWKNAEFSKGEEFLNKAFEMRKNSKEQAFEGLSNDSIGYYLQECRRYKK